MGKSWRVDGQRCFLTVGGLMDCYCSATRPRLLGLLVCIPLRAWVTSVVFSVCCVGSDLCDGLITHPEKS